MNNIYSSQDKFSRGVGISLCLSIGIPYFTFIDGANYYILIMTLFFVWLVNSEYRIFILLYKKGNVERRFVLLFLASLFLNTTLSWFFAKNITILCVLLIWSAYISIFYSKKIFNANADLIRVNRSRGQNT